MVPGQPWALRAAVRGAAETPLNRGIRLRQELRARHAQGVGWEGPRSWTLQCPCPSPAPAAAPGPAFTSSTTGGWEGPECQGEVAAPGRQKAKQPSVPGSPVVGEQGLLQDTHQRRRGLGGGGGPLPFRPPAGKGHSWCLQHLWAVAAAMGAEDAAPRYVRPHCCVWG